MTVIAGMVLIVFGISAFNDGSTGAGLFAMCFGALLIGFGD